MKNLAILLFTFFGVLNSFAADKASFRLKPLALLNLVPSKWLKESHFLYHRNPSKLKLNQELEKSLSFQNYIYSQVENKIRTNPVIEVVTEENDSPEILLKKRKLLLIV